MQAASRATTSTAAATRLPLARLLHASPSLSKVVPDKVKGRSKSSHEWLTRQLNDKYVKLAHKEHYRARSAFKLLELQKKLQLLRPGLGVLDCGCAPGSWLQVLARHCNPVTQTGEKCAEYDPSLPAGRVVGADLLPVSAVTGVMLLANADCSQRETQQRMLEMLHPHKLDLLLSDMAPNATGVKSLDHEQIMRLAYGVAHLSKNCGAQGSSFLCKVWDGPYMKRFKEQLVVLFDEVRIVKPPCSRENSPETFVFAQGLKKARDTLYEGDCSTISGTDIDTGHKKNSHCTNNDNKKNSHCNNNDDSTNRYYNNAVNDSDCNKQTGSL